MRGRKGRVFDKLDKLAHGRNIIHNGHQAMSCCGVVVQAASVDGGVIAAAGSDAAAHLRTMTTTTFANFNGPYVR